MSFYLIGSAEIKGTWAGSVVRLKMILTTPQTIGATNMASPLAKIEAIQDLIAESQRTISALRRQLEGVRDRMTQEERLVELLNTKLVALRGFDRAAIAPVLRNLLANHGGELPIRVALNTLHEMGHVRTEDLAALLCATVEASPDMVIREDCVRLLGGRRRPAPEQKKTTP